MAVPLPLLRRAAENYFLGRVYCVSFEVTHRCNAKCEHCQRGCPVPDERRASVDRLVEICQGLRPILSIMSGGEPLMRRDLEEIVRRFKATGASSRVNVNTNAALLRPDRFASLKEAGIDNFVISFDFPDERHDEWRAIPGLFAKIESLVTGLSPADKKRVALTCVFNSQNFREAPAMAEVARKWGVSINFSAYTWLRTGDTSLVIQPDEMEEARAVVAEISEMGRRYGHVLTSDGVLAGMLKFYETRRMDGCQAGKRLLVVNPDGTFSPCGLHVTDYQTRAALLEGFTKHNECAACYTISRALTERPLGHFVKDNLHLLRTTGPDARVEA